MYLKLHNDGFNVEVKRKYESTFPEILLCAAMIVVFLKNRLTNKFFQFPGNLKYNHFYNVSVCHQSHLHNTNHASLGTGPGLAVQDYTDVNVMVLCIRRERPGRYTIAPECTLACRVA